MFIEQVEILFVLNRLITAKRGFWHSQQYSSRLNMNLVHIVELKVCICIRTRTEIQHLNLEKCKALPHDQGGKHNVESDATTRLYAVDSWQSDDSVTGSRPFMVGIPTIPICCVPRIYLRLDSTH